MVHGLLNASHRGLNPLTLHEQALSAHRDLGAIPLEFSLINRFVRIRFQPSLVFSVAFCQ